MRLHLVLLAGAALPFFVASTRAAAPPDPDEQPTLAPRLELLHDLDDEAGIPGRRAPLWLGVSATVRTGDGERQFGGMVLLEIPLERFARQGRSLTPTFSQDQPALKPARAAPKREQAPVEGAEPAPAADAKLPVQAPEEPPLAIPVAITPAVARAAVRAALAEARLGSAEARLDALASRARSSAVLPELRVRATRLVDEAQNLSPTEYDPGRTTASGGTSLWLEARATWRLDRLVFADEEVAIERMRAERAEAQVKLVSRVLELLFAWQRALALEAAAHLPPEEHLAASLKVLEAAAALDVVTGGWFAKWSRRPAAVSR